MRVGLSHATFAVQGIPTKTVSASKVTILTNPRTKETPRRAAAMDGHAEILNCRMNLGASLTARTTTTGLLPIDDAANDAIKQLIRDEEIRRRDHGFRRAVLPNPAAAERYSTLNNIKTSAQIQ